MRIPLLCSLALLAAACGNRIGDSCTVSSDCSQQGDRICDVASPGGYCTIFGCDHDSCPDEAVCVRFFSVSETNLTCDPLTEDRPGGANDCSPDELCTLAGYCVPRTAEMRFCMLRCNGPGDCRDDYECRNRELMIQNGGEPVPVPGETVSDDPQPFCAAAPIR